MNRAERRRLQRLQEKHGGTSSPPHVRSWLEEGIRLHRAGRLTQAEALYQRVLEVMPAHPEALHLLGVAAYQQGRADQARMLIARAIHSNPRQAVYHFNHGLACQQLKDLEAAAASYDTAIKLNPAYVEALTNRGNLYREQGQLSQAVDMYRRAVHLKPDYAEGYNNLGVAFKEQRQFTDAVEAYRQALALNPHNAQTHCNLGMVYMEQDRINDAIRAFEQATRLDPRYAKAYHNLGLAFIAKSQWPEALTALRQSAELTHNHGRPVTLKWVFPSRIKHDAEQLDYLAERGILDPMWHPYQEALQVLRRRCEREAPRSNHPIALTEEEARSIAPSFNRIVYLKECPIVPAGAINPCLDVEDIQRRYYERHPEILWVDDLLTSEALQALRQFCLESTIWKRDYPNGYVGAFLGDGFACPLLLQIAEELRTRFPKIFRHHRLLQAWAFKQDSTLLPLNIHADAAAVNVNFWITDNQANLDPTSGGLIVWDKEAPQEWDFRVYNDTKFKPQIMEFLRTAGAQAVTVPYRENRALFFNSDLFHASDRCQFKDEYTGRRINVTLLYGHRFDKVQVN
ncbi:MAG: tetratricopeptide repeat protein [Nitrospirae bacterium]|nr:MAG: tetratricopeptide repeat protein [Nitrospirota bacterium]